MKRSWLITIFICLLLLGGGGAVLFLPQVVPFDQCSDVYKKYAGMDGVDATFIRDYKVNDTVFVDATYLKAKDTASWNFIAKELGVPPPPVIPDEYKSLFQQSNSFGYFVVKDKSDTIIQFYTSPKNICTFSRDKMIICIFHTCNERQIDAILDKNIDKITH